MRRYIAILLSILYSLVLFHSILPVGLHAHYNEQDEICTNFEHEHTHTDTISFACSHTHSHPEDTDRCISEVEVLPSTTNLPLPTIQFFSLMEGKLFLPEKEDLSFFDYSFFITNITKDGFLKHISFRAPPLFI